MKVPNIRFRLRLGLVSLSRLQNEGSQLVVVFTYLAGKSIKATE